MIDRANVLPLTRQATLLRVSRSGVCYLPRPVPPSRLAIMHRIDALHLEHPFAGSRMLRDMLRREGIRIGRLAVATLMRRMGIVALYRRPNTSKPAPGHKIYPYLLRNLVVDLPNHVWAMDITYIPIRCRVHFMRNATAHAGKTQRRIVSAWIGTAFAEADAPAAHTQWRTVADQLRPKVPKLAALMDAAEHDVLAYMDFPREHRAKLHSTNPIERLNGEIKRRTDVVGIFPNEAAITRLVGAILLEQSDEWATQRARYMTLETMSAISDTEPVSLPAVAA